MKRMKRFLLLVLFLLITTGCSVNPETNNDTSNSEDEIIHLNIQEANLIASMTDNEKYLNKDILVDLKTLNDDDKVNIIVTLNSKGLADEYNTNSKGYNTLSSYANSRVANKQIENMTIEQNEMIQKLIDEKYINQVNHSFTTIFNGFSATTTYGQFKKLEKAGLDIEVTLSEVYSEPKYQVASADKTGRNSTTTVTNFVNVYETGIFNSSGVGYDGENTAVAILDSGFDIHHTVFQNMPASPMITIQDVENVLYESKAYSYSQNIKAQDVYVNTKIPFAFDYADKDSDVATYDSDHGTHVAGIIGGKDDVITGVAINTQLVLMKVFGDINNGAIQDDILAALEDAILLGVDAINLSLGSACGFARSSDNEYINVVYDRIEEAGIMLLVAASNDYSSGYGGAESNTNKASNPDSATIGSPGSFAASFSVASISGVKSNYIVDETGYQFFFNNANNNAGQAYNFYDMLFEKLNTTKDEIRLEYVTVPGVGKKVNYSNIDVEGKIALVKRGDISFEEKAQIALDQGAIGCIIYNNIAGDVFMSAGSHLKIALCSISKDDGEHLASSGTGVLILNKNYLAGPFMSEFSSWGPVSDLSLKPEITAHGGSIYSSVHGGGYDKISGTSMACPNLCGVVILVRQALKERYPDKTAVELKDMTNQLLMSTATIVFDEYGNPYSPRKQGSGLGNLQYALDTKAYLSVEGMAKSKLELKDDPQEKGVYELVFQVNNISKEELKYRLNDFTMTESLSTADPEFVAEKAYMLDPSTIKEVTGDGTLDGDIITVNPNGTATISYTITLSEAEKKYIRESFINGMYVEGFAVLESLNEDEIDLSIPFLAFFGDWTVAPMFDKTYFEVESEAYNGAIDEEDKLKADYYATMPLGTFYYSYFLPLGTYVYEMDESKYDPIPASEEHCAIGYNLQSINGITSIYAGLLRNTKKMTSVITNSATGEVVYEHIKYDEHKAYYSGQIVPGYDLIEVSAAELGLQNNTQYTFSMLAELDYKDGGINTNLNNTFEFSFYVDYESPIVEDCQFYTKYDKSLKDYRHYVDVYVYDNHYAQAIRPFTLVNNELVSLVDYVIPIYSERGQTNKVTVEITDYIDLLKYGSLEGEDAPLTNGLGFLVEDYALNQTYVYVTLPGTNSSEIEYKQEYYSSAANGTYQYFKDLYVGDELDLATMLQSNDPTLPENPEVQVQYFENLYWKSSDENVVKVKNGKIEAVGAGNVIVSCSYTNTNGFLNKTNLKLRVRDRAVEDTNQKLTDIEFTYFDVLSAFQDGPEISEIGETGQRKFFTEVPIISFYPGESVQLGYELEPWNLKNYELVWDSTNEQVASVDENGVVKALKEGSATITLKVKVDGKNSSLTASARVVVKNEFIVEGNTLVAYKGLGGDVVIPDDEGILYIGSFAFSLYTTDYEVEIEDDNYDDAKTPSSNNTVTSVTIPFEVLEVQKYAFYNCTALEKVEFLSGVDKTTGDVKSCDIIREYAFAKNKKLKEINLDKVLIIGANAFSDCESLTNINTSNIYAMGNRAFRNCKGLETIDITKLRNAGEEIFLNCENLKTVINGKYTNFSERMFRNSGLTNIVFEADRIPNNCFENCKDLQSVTITRTLVYIGRNAFNNCTSLKEVTFNDNAGAEFIYEYAFNDCSNLETVILPDSACIYERKVFNNCSSLQNVTFNKNSYIMENHGSLFNGCNSLQKFNVNNENEYYVSNNNLLLTKDNKSIVLAALNYSYGTYTIPSGIEVINEGAFSSITNLEKLIIPENVKEINASAFENCTNLTEITITDEDLVIKEKTFSGCSKLSNVINMNLIKVFAPYVFSNTAFKTINLVDVVINEGAFIGINTLTNVNVKSNEIIGDYAFSDCSELVSVEITGNQIGNYTFNNCVKLVDVKLNDVYEIGNYSFNGCSSIKTIDFDSLKYIGNYAFADCSSLEEVKLDSIITIGDYAFAASEKKKINQIKEINFGDTLTKIGSYAFNLSSNLENVVIGNGIESIGSYAFANCEKLVSFKTTGTLSTIEECVFCECFELVTVDIKGIEYINGGAFLNCVKLDGIDLSNVIEVGEQAFYGCANIINVELPKAIKLHDGAFLNCANLESINIPVVEYIGFQALSMIGVTSIKLPETVSFVSTAAFYFNVNQESFTDMNGNETCEINDYVLLDNGVLYTKTANDKYTLVAYPTAKQDSSYTVLFETVRIDEYAGYCNEYITSIVFPDTLKLIGNMCFYGCDKLRTVEFRSTVAPTLEGTVSLTDVEYDPSTDAYKLVNKYFQFNDYQPLFYAHFVDLVGVAKKLNIVLPSNSNLEGYEEILYKLYFDLENKTISDYEAMNKNSIDYLNKVKLVPTTVKLNNEKVIQDARTAYNLLNQDLTTYGYDKDYLDSLYNNLVQAETAWLELKMNRINKVYQFLIEDINALGSNYDFNKISDYYEVSSKIEMLDRNDKKYIDISNVESFKKGFDEYFKELNEDINVVTDVTTLPTTTVNKVGLVMTLSLSTLSIGVVVLAFFRKRWFL